MQVGRKISAPLYVQTNFRMMLRGIGSPICVRRYPVSMSCEISVLISMTSPRRARAGTLTSTRATLRLLQTGRERDDDVALADQTLPSPSSPSATTVCVSASRTRVDTRARPARGPRWNATTFGCGFFSVNTWMALT